MSSVEVREASLASPARARSLFTVRAAISSASSSGTPRSSSPCSMWRYWRSRLAFHRFIGIALFLGILDPLSGVTDPYPAIAGVDGAARPPARDMAGGSSG